MIAATLNIWILFVAGLVALAVQVWAFADCLRAKPEEFERTFKRTKQFWLLITGLSMLVGVFYLLVPMASMGLLLNVAACVGAGAYLADVRPAIQEVRGGGGRAAGPYGPW